MNKYFYKNYMIKIFLIELSIEIITKLSLLSILITNYSILISLYQFDLSSTSRRLQQHMGTAPLGVDGGGHRHHSKAQRRSAAAMKQRQGLLTGKDGKG